MRTKCSCILTATVISAVAFLMPLMSSAAVISQAVTFSSSGVVSLSMPTTGGGRGDGHYFLWAQDPHGPQGATSTISSVYGTPYDTLGSFWTASGVNVWTTNLGCTLVLTTGVECPLNASANLDPVANALPVGQYVLEVQDTNYTLGNDYVWYYLYWNGNIFTSGYSINWSSYGSPFVYSTSSAALATTSALWSGLDIASSTVSCDSGNIFADGLCAAFSYLFVPSTSAVNGLVSQEINAENKFPFSWIFGLQSAINGLSTSTASTTDFAINWGAMGVGTSTPLGLANLAPASTSIFSAQVVKGYIGDSNWTLFQALIAAGVWLTFAADVFFTARNQMSRV